MDIIFEWLLIKQPQGGPSKCFLNTGGLGNKGTCIEFVLLWLDSCSRQVVTDHEDTGFLKLPLLC